MMFPAMPIGSLIVKDGKVVGSSLDRPGLHERRAISSRARRRLRRPIRQDASKTVDAPYNAAASAGSNLGPITKKLLDRVQGDVDEPARGRRQRS